MAPLPSLVPARRGVIYLILAGLALVSLPANRAHGQIASGATGNYLPGWNLAGGPPSTNLSSALAIYAYDGSQYVVPSSARTDGCTGYWVYYNAAVSVALAQTQTGTSQNCPLRAGWTIVGNPFDAVAALPPNVTAMAWDAVSSTWQPVRQIVPGGAVFIYSGSSTTVTLTALAVASSGSEVTIQPLQEPNHGPYTVHVGDTIHLAVPAPYTQATADPAYLQLLSHGIASPTATCGSNCAPIWFWEYRAIRAGTTMIDLAPACRQSSPPCELPDRVVPIVIVSQ